MLHLRRSAVLMHLVFPCRLPCRILRDALSGACPSRCIFGYKHVAPDSARTVLRHYDFAFKRQLGKAPLGAQRL